MPLIVREADRLSRQVRVRVTPALARQLRAKAQAVGCSRSELLRLLIEQAEVRALMAPVNDQGEGGSE